MIPFTAGFFAQDFETEEQPTHTYRIDLTAGRIRGEADELEAMRQAVGKILLTERFQYDMYSADYGIETLDLYGQPVSYVCPELERRIAEALLWDGRVQSVTDFQFETAVGSDAKGLPSGCPQKGVIHAGFTVHTIFGEIRAEKEVKI